MLDVDDVCIDKLTDEELLADAQLRAEMYRDQPDCPTFRLQQASGAPSLLEPRKTLGDRNRWYRSRGQSGEGALATEHGDKADRFSSTQLESKSLLKLHMETGGNYIAGGPHFTFPNPDVLEVCRECGDPLNLPDERKRGGQVKYCSKRREQDRKNRKRRNRTARESGKRVLSTYSCAYGVPSGQKSTGPQERLATGDVAPWTVPCWAADPWLKFYLAGSVPIGRHLEPSYSDPTGSLAVENVYSGRRTRGSDAIGIPVGKPDPDAKPYVHNIFDAVFEGMDNYRTMILAGKPENRA